ANVIRFMAGEEHKGEPGPKKILGRLAGARIEPHPVTLSAQTTRVGVQDGHTASLSVRLDQKPSAEAVVDAFMAFKGRPQERKLPSAPEQPVVYLHERNRP